MISVPSHILNEADPSLLEQAAADNYKQLVCMEAIAWGGEVKEKDGLIWTYAGQCYSATMPFPSPAAANSGALLDEMMDYYRSHRPNGAGYWSLDPPQPHDIGIQLLARGFQPGWRPCWMALDLTAINDKHPAPEGLRVRGDNDTDIHRMKDLPYSANNNILTPAFRKAHPQLAQRFIASLRGKVVGQSAVFFSTGAYGVAGIYNVGVVPDMQNKGIGKAVTLAACLYARERGYRYAVLNASDSGRRIYPQIGFQWVGDGLTWWLMGERWLTNPPSREQVALAEAVGRGDMATLDSMSASLARIDLNTPVTNMTLMELASYCRQPASAEWLMANGAACTALAAWELGWTDRAQALLAGNPQEVNRQYGEGRLTLLHTAAQRNDIALAKLALSARPDLSLTDSWYNGTPPGWAHHFQRTEIIQLIKAYTGEHLTT